MNWLVIKMLFNIKFILLSVTLLLIILLGFGFKHEYNKNIKLIANEKILLRNINSYKKVLFANTKLSQNTDTIVTKVIKQSSNISKEINLLKRGVNETFKKASIHKISNTAANNIYLNSMWVAYCKASPSDKSCSSSLFDKKLQHK